MADCKYVYAFDFKHHPKEPGDEKFMKGGPEDKIEDVLVEAEVETNVTQEELNQWLIKV
jgi:hypothetical protein